jgi:hypothetical protein
MVAKLSIFITLTIIGFAVTEEKLPLKWWDCGTTDAKVHFYDAKFSNPFPITGVMSFGGKFKIDEEMPRGTYTRIDLWRKVNLLLGTINVKVPCAGWLGSCPYDLCDFSLKSDNYYCDFLTTRANATCDCPYPAQMVEGYDYKVKLPDSVFTIIGSLFASVSHY